MKKIWHALLALVVLAGMLNVTAFAARNTFSSSQGINVISREDGSGTRSAFVELFEVQETAKDGKKTDATTEDAFITNSTSVMMTSVAIDAHAIGYLSLGSLNDTVKALNIGGVEATTENIKNGTYKIFRPFNIATKGNESAAAKDFMAFIMSASGQKVIETNGYISVAPGAAYKASGLSGKVVVAGSSSVTPVMEKLKEAYLKLNPNVKVEIQMSDSSAGMTAAINGVCDIGMASRELKDSELEKGLKSTVIAYDGIAVIVSKENPLASLTVKQVRDIFTGSTWKWSKLVK